MEKRKKTKKVPVDKEFLMKITKQVDNLTKEVKEIKKLKKDKGTHRGTPNKTPRFDWSVTFRVDSLDKQVNLQKSFYNNLVSLLLSYPITKLDVNYEKQNPQKTS